jgi:hypothetical protein
MDRDQLGPPLHGVLEIVDLVLVADQLVSDLPQLDRSNQR